MQEKKTRASYFHQKSKEYFPVLNNKQNIINEKNQTFVHNSQNLSQTKKIKNVKRSSSSSVFPFSKRSSLYKIKVDNSNKKMPFKNINEEELNLILYKLKNYYNDLIVVTNDNDKNIQLLNKTIKVKEKKLEQYLDFKDFELPDEKISAKDFSKLHETRKDIEKKIKDLISEKQKLEDLLQNEKQYLKSLEYMHEIGKNKSLEVKKEINDLEFNLFNTQKNLGILESNLEGYTNKNMGFNELDQKLQNNIDLAYKVIEHQMDENSKLNLKILNKEKKTDDLKKYIKQKKEQNKMELDLYKDMKITDIKMAHEREKEKIEKEKYYIEIITSLYLIQKYFINNYNNFDKKDLETDKDYINLKTHNFLLKDLQKKDGEKSRINDNDNMNNFVLSNNDKNGVPPNADNNNNSNIPLDENNENNELEDRNNRNNLINDLKQKLDSINVDKEQLFDFYSELSSKVSFYLKNLNIFHDKQITLENKKESLNKKVKTLLEKDFCYFEELTKNNTRFQNYNKTNESFIKELKMKKKSKEFEEMNKEIKKKEKNKVQLKPIEEISKIKKEQKLNDSKALYSKIDNLILTNTNFVSMIMDLLNNIITIANKSLKNNGTNKDYFRSSLPSKTHRALKTDKYEKYSEYIKKESSIDLRNQAYQSLNVSVKEDNICSDFFKELFYLYGRMVNFDEANQKNINNDKENIISYIEKLINYYNDNKDLKESQDIDINTIKNTLLNNSYKNGDKKNINKLFNESLINSNISNKNAIFNYFINIGSQNIENIKLIVDFLINYENNSNLMVELEKLNNSSKELSYEKASTKKSKPKEKPKIKNNTNTNNTNNTNTNTNNNMSEVMEIKCGEYEQDESSVESEVSGKDKKVSLKKVYSAGKKISNRLYKPFLEKTYFIRKLNKNMNDIKSETLKNARTIFALAKKKNEERLISNQMLIYNNPNLNINSLSVPIYQELNSLIIRTKQIKDIRKKGKRIKSSSIFKKKLYKNINKY